MDDDDFASIFGAPPSSKPAENLAQPNSSRLPASTQAFAAPKAKADDDDDLFSELFGSAPPPKPQPAQSQAPPSALPAVPLPLPVSTQAKVDAFPMPAAPTPHMGLRQNSWSKPAASAVSSFSKPDPIVTSAEEDEDDEFIVTLDDPDGTMGSTPGSTTAGGGTPGSERGRTWVRSNSLPVAGTQGAATPSSAPSFRPPPPGLGPPGIRPPIPAAIPGPKPPSEPYPGSKANSAGPPGPPGGPPAPPGQRPPFGPGGGGGRPQFAGPQFPNDPDAAFPMAARPDQSIKLPRQTRVTPDEYREFLALGHGEIFDLDLDRLIEAPWRAPTADAADYFNYGMDERGWRDYQRRIIKFRAEYTLRDRIQSVGSVDQGLGAAPMLDPDLPPEVAALIASTLAKQSNQANRQQALALEGGPSNAPLPLPSTDPTDKSHMAMPIPSMERDEDGSSQAQTDWGGGRGGGCFITDRSRQLKRTVPRLDPEVVIVLSASVDIDFEKETVVNIDYDPPSAASLARPKPPSGPLPPSTMAAGGNGRRPASSKADSAAEAGPAGRGEIKMEDGGGAGAEDRKEGRRDRRDGGNGDGSGGGVGGGGRNRGGGDWGGGRGGGRGPWGGRGGGGRFGPMHFEGGPDFHGMPDLMGGPGPGMDMPPLMMMGEGGHMGMMGDGGHMGMPPIMGDGMDGMGMPSLMGDGMDGMGMPPMMPGGMGDMPPGMMGHGPDRSDMGDMPPLLRGGRPGGPLGRFPGPFPGLPGPGGPPPPPPPKRIQVKQEESAREDRWGGDGGFMGGDDEFMHDEEVGFGGEQQRGSGIRLGPRGSAGGNVLDLLNESDPGRGQSFGEGYLDDGFMGGSGTPTGTGTPRRSSLLSSRRSRSRSKSKDRGRGKSDRERGGLRRDRSRSRDRPERGPSHRDSVADKDRDRDKDKDRDSSRRGRDDKDRLRESSRRSRSRSRDRREKDRERDKERDKEKEKDKEKERSKKDSSKSSKDREKDKDRDRSRR